MVFLNVIFVFLMLFNIRCYGVPPLTMDEAVQSNYNF